MQNPNQRHDHTVSPEPETAKPEASQPEPRPVPKQNKPTCFRITGIPPHWDRGRLEKELRNIDPELDPMGAEVSGPFPDSCDPTQTALLNMDECTPYFTFEHSQEKLEAINERGKKVQLVFDNHFYDLTPLNRAEEPIELELVNPQRGVPQMLTCSPTAS